MNSQDATERRIVLTGGNVRHHHFYLHNCESLLPGDAIGGGNRNAPGAPLSVRFEPGQTVQTDVAGDKMIFRCRAAMREFLEGTAAEEGDVVVLERTGERGFDVRLEKKSIGERGRLGYPNRILRALPEPPHFDVVWLISLHGVADDGSYAYDAICLQEENGNAPVWRIDIAPGFDDWNVKRVQ
jgi:hypothetical protein